MSAAEETDELTLDSIALALYEFAKRHDEDKAEIAQIINDTAQEIYTSVQGQVEANEKIIAQLLPAYQELSLAVEVIVWKMWGDSPEESADFKAKLGAARTRMVDWIKGATNAMQVDERDLAAALGELFPAKSPDGAGSDSGPADDVT